MKSILITTILILSVLHAEEKRTKTEGLPEFLKTEPFAKLPLKDPSLASILSATLPGLGHIYAEEYLRGSLFFVGVAVPFILSQAILYRQSKDIQETFTITDNQGNDHIITQRPHDKDGHNIRVFSKLNTTEKAAVIGGYVTGVGIWAFNAIDAYLCAKRYNDAYLSTRYSLSPIVPVGGFGLALNLSF